MDEIILIVAKAVLVALPFTWLFTHTGDSLP